MLSFEFHQERAETLENISLILLRSLVHFIQEKIKVESFHVFSSGSKEILLIEGFVPIQDQCLYQFIKICIYCLSVGTSTLLSFHTSTILVTLHMILSPVIISASQSSR